MVLYLQWFITFQWEEVKINEEDDDDDQDDSGTASGGQTGFSLIQLVTFNKCSQPVVIKLKFS